MKYFLWITMLLVACDSGGGIDSDDVKELKIEVGVLIDRIEALEALVAQQAQTLANTEDALSWATDMSAVASLNENGDVVFEGVNVYVQSGSGSTYGEANGKGNLIVGYDEDRIEGTCVGGDSEGNSCDYNSECDGGGTCENYVVTSEKTGSHNLVVGAEHTYAGSGNMIGGQENTVTGSASVCMGHYNEVSGDWAAIVGGVGNAVEAHVSVIVGGGGNDVNSTAEYTVILGGQENTATDDNYAIVPAP